MVQSAGNPGTFATLSGASAGKTQTADATGLVLAQGGLTYIWDGGDTVDATDFFRPLNWNLDSGIPGVIDTAILQTAQMIVLGSAASVGTFQQSAGTFSGAGAFTVLTSFDWTGGTQSGAGSTISSGTLTLSGAGAKTLTTRSLINNGTVNLSGAGGLTTSNATITNNGVFNATDEADVAGSGSGGFTNSATGTLNKSGAGTTSAFYIFSNAGTVNAASGTLNFGNGFTQTAGSVVLSGGSITGAFAFNFQGGELRGTGSIGTNATLVNNGAIIRPGGTGAAGTLTIAAFYEHRAGGTLAVEVGGAAAGQFDVLAVTGNAAISGGAMDVSFLGGFTPGSSDTFRVLMAANRSGNFQFVNGPTLIAQYNPTNVTLVVAPAGQFTWDAGGLADTSWLNPANWSPDGVPGATDSATLAINATTTLPANHSVGTLLHQSGNAILTIPTGVTLTVLTNFTWTGGTENGAGTLTVAPGGTFTFPGTSGQNAFLTERTLNLQGTSTFSNASSEVIVLAGNATINNSGNLEIRHQLTINNAAGNSGFFNNLAGGTVRGTTATTSLITGGSVTSTNAGILRAELGSLFFNGVLTQTAGSAQLAGGTLGTVIFQLQGGELVGTGTFGGTVNNTGGVVRPGGTGVIGTLTTNGTYRQFAGGTLETEVAGTGAGQFDVFVPQGNAFLDGTLNAPLLGGFTPGTGNTFRVLDAGVGGSGTFATVNSPLTAQYNAGDVTLLTPVTTLETVVTTSLDTVNATDGVVSLREAITFANATAGTDTITFAIPGGGVKTITVSSALPALTEAAVIDGYTQPGSSANTLATGNNAVLNVVLRGASSTLGNGLTLSAGGVTVRGLVVQNFTDGIFVGGANAIIAGNWIGVSQTGTAAAGNADDGIQVNANGALIGGTTPAARNVISASGQRGIEITGGFGSATVQGNNIGTNATGTAALGNGEGGVRAGTNNVNSPNVLITGNVISGNLEAGIHVQDGSGTIITGNFIGTNATGLAAIPNVTGVILNTMTNSRIGGTTAAERNVISGNGTGIFLFRGGSGNSVQGNYIGTGAGGNAALGNGTGIDFSQSSGTTIGGTTAGAGNVISGNAVNGINVGSGSTGNFIQGNFIGTNAAGTAAVANGDGGIQLLQGANNNTIGGTTAAARNVISGNLARGVLIFSDGNTVQGNYIGTNASGLGAVKNAFDGLTIAAPGSNNLIGGAAAGAGNVISGNDISGVTIESFVASVSPATGNRVQGNIIGLAADGVTRLGNTAGSQLGWGIGLFRLASGNFIGGTGAGEGNVIAANAGPGIELELGPTGNRIEGNFIGTNAAGAAGLGNGDSGIIIDRAPSNIIGNPSADQVVVASARHGIEITGTGSTGNLVQNNFAGLTPATFPGGARAIPNALAGIAILNGASGNDIGGTARGNVAAGNTGDGVLIDNANNNVVRGNRIGHVQVLTQFIPNGGAGVHVIGGTGNRIGSTALSELNGILHNTGAGILVEGNGAIATARGNILEGNGGLGIDLGGNGVTANDAGDADSGPNTLLNFPTLSSVIRTASGGGYDYTVSGSYSGAPNTAVTIDLYANPAADASGNGEGMFVIHSFSVTTDAAGAAAFTRNFTGTVNAAFFNVPFGDFITAQATLGNGASGPSSEFSPAMLASLFTTRISVLDAAAAEGQGGTNTITFRLQLSAAATAPVSVHFATHDLTTPGAAAAGVDYLATQGDVTFAIGETEKTIAITLNGDTTPEARERFGLTLSAATGAGLDDAEATGAILDDDHHLFFAAQGSGSRVEIRDAEDGALVRGFFAFAPGFKGGVRVASGDVNGDGFNDVVVGTGDGGGARVRVFDGHNVGANGRPVKLHDFYAYGNGYRGGVYVAAGDVDGDGKADIIVAPGAGSSGLVKVFSGADGSLHSSFLAFGRGAGGVRVAAGDINGDGHADIIAGSGAGASVRVFDGLKTGEILSSFRAFPRSFAGGITVAGGDVNGDGRDDVIVGAGRGSSVARIFLGGQPGDPVEFAAFGDSTRGINVGAVDLNSDGIADIIAAQARNAAPKLRIYNGNSVLNGTPRAPVNVTAFAFDPDFAGGVYVG